MNPLLSLRSPANVRYRTWAWPPRVHWRRREAGADSATLIGLLIVCVVVAKTARSTVRRVLLVDDERGWLLAVRQHCGFSRFAITWMKRALQRSERQSPCDKTWLVAPAADSHGTDELMMTDEQFSFSFSLYCRYKNWMRGFITSHSAVACDIGHPSDQYRS